MKPIDLRSDTVTRPTPAMREAMAEAEVGDDVFGEDPTVNRLEARAAELLGFEAALFVPSGTMGNAIAIRILTERGDEVLVERRSHVVRYELSAMSVLSGVMPRMVDAPGGHLTPEHVRAARGAPGLLQVRRDAWSCSRTPTTSAGARCQGSRRSQAVIAAARECGFRVHLDGARIWNAAVALGVAAVGARGGRGHGHDLPVEGPRRAGRLARGLVARAHREGAPGAEAARRRHAPGRRPRRRRPRGPRRPWSRASAEDHANARLLGGGARPRDRACASRPVETNIVVATLEGRTAPGGRLGPAGERASSRIAMDARTLRLVTHRDVSREDCERAACGDRADPRLSPVRGPARVRRAGRAEPRANTGRVVGWAGHGAS